MDNFISEVLRDLQNTNHYPLLQQAMGAGFMGNRNVIPAYFGA